MIITFLSFVSNVLCEISFIEKEYPKDQDSATNEIFKCKFINDTTIYVQGAYFTKGFSLAKSFMSLFDIDFNLLHHTFYDTTSSQSLNLFLRRMFDFIQNEDGTYSLIGNKIVPPFADLHIFNSKLLSPDLKIIKDTSFIYPVNEDNFLSFVVQNKNKIGILGINSKDSIKSFLYFKEVNELNQIMRIKTFNFLDSITLNTLELGIGFIDKDSNYLFFNQSGYATDSLSYIFSHFIKIDKLGNLICHNIVDSLHILSIIATEYDLIKLIDPDNIAISYNKDRIFTYNTIDSAKVLFTYRDLDMNIIWCKEYQFNDFNGINLSYNFPTSNGDIVLAGKCRRPNKNLKPFICKLDSIGNIVWELEVKNDFIPEGYNQARVYDITGNSKNEYLALCGYKHYDKEKIKITTFVKITEKSGVGVEYFTYSNALEINPNPVSDLADLKFNLANACSAKLRIINEKGAEVSAAEYSLEAGTQNLRINTANLPSGAYICELITSTCIYSNKFIKN